MKRFLIIGGLIIASSLVPVKAIAATFTQLVVYGDSLSDLGRASAATNGAAPPYSALTNGRFSNGPIWIEYLANSLGIAPTPISPNSLINTANFAVGGATTSTGNTIVTALGGIQNQVTNNSIGDSNALYVVWGGANDYLGGGITNPGVPVGNLSSEISTLISSGAKNILVPNLSNLGDLPGTRNLSNASDLTTLTQFHNAGLAASLNNLGRDNPDVKLSLLDVNSLVNQIVANPGNFGFSNTRDGCLLVGCNTITPTTSDTYLFWDTIHPTTAGHRLISDLALNTVSSTAVPEPTTILGSLLAFGSVVALKRQLKSSKLKDKKLVKAT
jgi:thermolabile hemolysin